MRLAQDAESDHVDRHLLRWYPHCHLDDVQVRIALCPGCLQIPNRAIRVKGAIIAGIALVSIISWPRGTDVTFFPHTPIGDSNFDFFKKVVTFHKIEKTLNVLDWNVMNAGSQFGLGESWPVLQISE